MIWMVFALGVVLGFVLGVIAVRRLIHEERKKALEMATSLINARELVETRPPPTASVSFAGNQQWDYVVICGGTNDPEA